VSSRLAPSHVGRFEIRDFLGRGAIGDVWLAWDPQAGREVALKVVRTSRADPEMLEAERNGVALQAQLAAAAPQVAAVFEQGADGEFFWVAMEYVAGDDLSRVLSAGALPEDLAVTIALQLCRMLEVCHDFAAEVGGRAIHGIVHGDIKPENIRLQDGGRVRVLDFGIAKHLSQTRRFTVNLFGSLPYTPPERLERGVVDRHSDLWAVGVVLYVMAAGRRPFPGDSAEELEQRIRVGERPLPPPESVSPRLRRILETCLAFDVADRYPSAAALRADLEALRDGRPLSAERAAAGGPAIDGDPSATRRTRPVAAAAGPEATRRTDVQERSAPPPAEATRRTAAEVPAGGEGSGGPVLLGGVPPLPPLPATEPATAAPVEPMAPVEPTAQTEPVAQAEPAPRRRRWPRVLIVLVVLTALVSSQVWVAGEAQEIRRQLVTERSPDLDQVWARYRRTARWSLLGIGMGALREELRDALVRSAERILDSYRGDNPTTTERGWRVAEQRLQSAAEIEGRNRELRARLLYSRAHLDRIEAQTLRGKGQRQQADERSQAAIAGFKEAAQRDPDWPDPYLGLARIYAYDRFDLAALQESLEQLEKRGYTLGRREQAMLADGHRMRGLQLQVVAAERRERDEEIGLLETARDHLRQAITRYQQIPSYADVGRNRTQAEEHLAQIEDRLWVLGVW
jgi:Protein kinase domain